LLFQNTLDFLEDVGRGEIALTAHQQGKANNPQQSWGFEGEPPKAVIKDSGTRDGTL
jgi:hypothetical protein